MKKLVLACLALLFPFAASAADWFFRGTPNGWGCTQMTADASGLVKLQVKFNGEQSPARFKVDRSCNWAESYPAADYGVTDFKTYDIAFNPSTKAITVTEVSVPVAQWFFRGTPNGWGCTAMTAAGGTQFKLQVKFNGEASPARFKVDRYCNWAESYPASDYGVADFKTYDISFDSSTKQVAATAVAGADTTPPTSAASPPAGTYSSAQAITLSASDNVDTAPAIYFTTNGTAPTTASTRYTGQAINATDVVTGTGVDLNLRVLVVDSAGNSSQASYAYVINPAVPPSNDFRAETIYFLLTARFNNGDSANDYYNRDRYKAGDPQWRGDFKGLIDKLDYIKDLGFTAIWITPPVVNRSGLDYHGYHAYDWTRVDPRLESPGATYQDLINAAHAKGLKVIQDVVINHSSQYGIRGKVFIDHLPIKCYRPSSGTINFGPYVGNLGDYLSPFREDNDNPLAPSWFAAKQNADANCDVAFNDPKTGHVVPSAGYDANRFFGIDAATLNATWYHQSGFISGGDWESPIPLQQKHIAGDAIDLATENQAVKDYMNGAIEHYLDMGVDAIRLDTAKHVERGNLLEYVNHWRVHKPGLFVFGEVMVKGTGWGDLGGDNGPSDIRPWWYTRLGTDKTNPNSGGDSGLSVLDFSLFSTFRDNVSRGSYSGIKAILDMDWVYGDATKLVTFLQNHDVGPDNDFRYRFKGETWMAAAAYNMLWTIRGIPTLYYGEEIEFQKGLPQDIVGSTDTLDMTGRAYYGDKINATNIATTQAHPLYKHIKRLNQIRRAVPALQKAPMSQVNEWGSGMSFIRDSGDSVAVVGLAIGSGQTINVSGVKSGTYRDAVTGNTLTTSNGNLSFTVQANSAGIYVLNGPGKIGVDGDFLK